MKEVNCWKSDSHYVPFNPILNGKGLEVRTDIYCYTTEMVNTIMLGEPNQKTWVMVDTGMPGKGHEVISVAKRRFGSDNKPSAILLTHGHFDQVGGISEMLQEWEVPVYAHPLEFPFLKSERNYPGPDSSAEVRRLAQSAFTYPLHNTAIADHLLPLSNDHTVPYLRDWVWLSSTSHSPRHISYYRTKDRTLISGDAFTTFRSDPSYKMLSKEKGVEEPPHYATTDWGAARESVRNLELLSPTLAIPAHFQPIMGWELTEALSFSAAEFDRNYISETNCGDD